MGIMSRDERERVSSCVLCHERDSFGRNMTILSLESRDNSTCLLPSPMHYRHYIEYLPTRRVPTGENRGQGGAGGVADRGAS